MDIEKIIEEVKNIPDCIVYSPCGLPELRNNDKLPNDLKVFYEKCGGISFYANKEYGFTIVSPKELLLANPIIVGELCEEDISSKWYTICKDGDGNYITIDLSTERLGRCYDSFWDRHGVVGECTIVAKTFTELLLRLYNNQGESLFWLDNDFVYIGDAYDKE